MLGQEQAAVRPRFVQLDLSDAVARAVETARPLLTRAHRLTTHLQQAAVVGDAASLQGVVASLIDNAIRYSPGGGPIHVSVTVEGAAAVCRVIDRGPGIAEQDLPALFAPFARFGERAGDGLALHLARELVLVHGGDVAVDSLPGVGTSFGVVLPLAGAEPPARYDVTRFGLGDMMACSAAARAAGALAWSYDDAARRIVAHLRERLVHRPEEERATVLVRLFRGRPDPDAPDSLRLELSATAGEREEWNHPALSVGHRVVPLPAGGWWPPMFARLLEALGLDAERAREPALVERTCNVLHVAEAAGSPSVPAQADFVEPYGVRSLVGFGGLVAPADLFAVVLFSRAPISRDSAVLFRAVSHSTKVALRRFTHDGGQPVYDAPAHGQR